MQFSVDVWIIVTELSCGDAYILVYSHRVEHVRAYDGIALDAFPCKKLL